jgi:hypothetical protein
MVICWHIRCSNSRQVSSKEEGHGMNRVNWRDLSITISALVFSGTFMLVLNGCSVFLALHQSAFQIKTDKDKIYEGVSRKVVEDKILRTPDSIQRYSDDSKIAHYYIITYPPDSSAKTKYQWPGLRYYQPNAIIDSWTPFQRALFYLFLDSFTLGVYEIETAPKEIQNVYEKNKRKQRWKCTIVYDQDDKVFVTDWTIQDTEIITDKEEAFQGMIKQ